MAKDKNELLIGSGREVAEQMLESAVTSAENADQMSNQIFVLKRASISILAHELYNQLRSTRSFEDARDVIDDASDSAIDDYMNDLMNDLLGELRLIAESSDVELLKTGKPS